MKIKSALLKRALVLINGSIIAQAIPILISPILTRLYSPEDFGKYGVFLAIIGILNPIITLRYELAIMLKVKEKELKYIIHTAFLTTSFVSILAFILILAVRIFSNFEVINELLLIPLSLILIGFYQCFY